MRVLKFIVDKQIIREDPSCDFSGLVPNSEGYLTAEFYFSQEWNGAVKVATFWSSLGREYEPQILKDGRTCIIPKEALEKRYFGIKVIGKKINDNDDGQKLVTNCVYVKQGGGIVT